MTRPLALAGVLLVIVGCAGEDDTTSIDDDTNPGASQRVVTFAPHLAEMMHAVGAGDQLRRFDLDGRAAPDEEADAESGQGERREPVGADGDRGGRRRAARRRGPA